MRNIRPRLLYSHTDIAKLPVRGKYRLYQRVAFVQVAHDSKTKPGGCLGSRSGRSGGCDEARRCTASLQSETQCAPTDSRCVTACACPGSNTPRQHRTTQRKHAGMIWSTIHCHNCIANAQANSGLHLRRKVLCLFDLA
eukprot:1895266-Rhodomonas_salina.3